MEVTLAVICDYANLSRDGKLNILGVFNGIEAPALPISVAQLFIVVSTEAGPTEAGQEFPFELVLWAQDGQEIFRVDQRLQFPATTYPGEHVSNNQIIAVAGLPFREAGDYAFHVRIGGLDRRTISLRVNDRSQKNDTSNA